MNNKKLYYILKSVWMVILLLVALILMNRDFTDLSEKKQAEEKDARLNIALINEDAGVTKNGKVYSLGNDYVKKIEKDGLYNWFTVSRGVGENGLKNGTYNLLVTIPSNFSEKLLELESTSPEQTQINYKINPNGNTTLENESNNVGRKIVNGLNQQLVDMYVASIMDNLFTAQKNIEKVYLNQEESVQGFQSVLYQPTIDFKQYLPSISTQSKSALQANDLLTETLSTYTKGTDALVSSHKDYSTEIEGLLKQRADGQLTYEEFIKILLSMDESLLSSETNQLYQTLEGRTNYLKEQFNLSDVEQNYTALIDQLHQQLDETQQEIDVQSEHLANLKDQYFETYKAQFFQAFHLEPTAENVTLKQALRLQGYDASDLSSITAFNKKYTEWMNERIALLPYVGSRDGDSYDQVFNYPYTPYGQQQPIITQLDEALNRTNGIYQRISDINNKNHTADNQTVTPLNTPQLETAKNSSYYRNVERTYNNLVNARSRIFAANRYNNSFTIELSDYEKTTMTFSIPAGIASVTINGTEYTEKDVPLTCELKWKTTVYYTFEESYDETTTPVPVIPITVNMGETSTENTETEELAQAEITEPQPVIQDNVEASTTSDTTGEEATAEKETAPKETTKEVVRTKVVRETEAKKLQWDQKVNVSMFLNEQYQQAKRNYSEEIGKVLSLYESVNAELAMYNSYPLEAMTSLLDTPMTDVFKYVIDKVFFAADGDYAKQEEQLRDLTNKAAAIENQSERLASQLQDVQKNTTELNETVTQQLPLLKEWQETMSKLTTTESDVNKNNMETDSELTSAKATLESLLSQTEMVKESSDMNVKEAESVKSVFDSFDKEVATAQKNGEDLSENADVIMNALTKELSSNRDFALAFAKVLSNAHQDGVPNNTFMQFIANPVAGKAETVIQTTEVNEPFTWILIMYTVSFFIAYLFVSQPIAQKVQNTFKKENLRIKNNLLEAGLLSLSSLVAGAVIGILSVGELGIAKESQISWVAIVLLFMLMFALLNHYAMKQFSIAGFGVSLFIFISYIFVTNALGKATGNNFFEQLVSRFNPLAIGENNLSTILVHDNLRVFPIICYVLVIMALFGINLIIWKPANRQKEGVAE